MMSGWISSARRIEPLTLRLSLCIMAVVVGPLLLGLYFLERQGASQALDARRRAAELESRILEAALRHQMLTKDVALMTKILEDIGRQPEVAAAMILDHRGVVKQASRADLKGSRLARDSPSCLVCHAKAPSERSHWVVLQEGSSKVLRSVLPIENRRECHGCHEPSRRHNGMLVLDLSLADMEAALRRQAVGIVAGTGLLGAVLVGSTSLLLRRLVLRRLAALGRSARALGAGSLTERAPVKGDDVISSLATDLNLMADAVTGLLREVQDRESRITSMINSLDDGLIVLDRDLRVAAANQSFCRRFGFHPEALRGLDCHEMRGALPCREEPRDCPALQCLRSGELQRATYRRTGKGSRDELVMEVYASPVFGDDGRVAQIVEIWRDIGERVREQERLAEMEHMASLGVLASGFSHEVNTPLATMLVGAESILGRIEEASPSDRGGLYPAVAESAQVIREEALRCRSITERFRRFARGVPPSVEPIDLPEIAASVVALAEPTARQTSVTLHLEKAPPLPAVAANTELVQHVLLNLLVNAIQSCREEGGAITVSFLDGPDVRVRVRDDGCGIPAELQPHIFEPFRSRKPQGTGLGLFLSRCFMRRFGGDVTLLSSESGSGSCFEVRFRRAEEGAP